MKCRAINIFILSLLSLYSGPLKAAPNERQNLAQPTCEKLLIRIAHQRLAAAKAIFEGRSSLLRREPDSKDAARVLLDVGQMVFVNQRGYSVREALGRGGEGAVYIVETSTGQRRAAKLYWKLHPETVADFSELLKEGISVIEIEDSDLSTGAIIFQLHEGIRIDDVIWDFSELGFNTEERDMILAEYEKLQKNVFEFYSRRGRNGVSVKGRNAIYDIYLKRVFLIDLF